MASTEPPQGQLKWLREFGALGNTLEMLFLSFTIYSAGGNIEEGGLPIPGANLFLKQGFETENLLGALAVSRSAQD